MSQISVYIPSVLSPCMRRHVDGASEKLPLLFTLLPEFERTSKIMIARVQESTWSLVRHSLYLPDTNSAACIKSNFHPSENS